MENWNIPNKEKAILRKINKGIQDTSRSFIVNNYEYYDLWKKGELLLDFLKIEGTDDTSSNVFCKNFFSEVRTNNQVRISDNQITQLECEVFELPSLINLEQLQHLVLDSVKVIPDDFHYPNKIKTISLTECTRTLYRHLDQLSQLTHLHVWDNNRNIQNILKESLKTLTELEVIHIYHEDPWYEPNNWLTSFPKLKKLSIFGEQCEIPENIGSMNSLEILAISESITDLPYSIQELTNLSTLSLSYVQIGKWYPSIAELPNLRTLYLSGPGIPHKFLSQILDGVTTLQKLDISDKLQLYEGYLDPLPPHITLPPPVLDMHNLEELYAKHNGYTKIPENIDDLENLRILDLSSNHIEEIPASLRNLDKLEELNLSINKIKVIPKWIYEMPNLQKINFEHNR